MKLFWFEETIDLINFFKIKKEILLIGINIQI